MKNKKRIIWGGILVIVVLIFLGFWFRRERINNKSLNNKAEKQELITESKDEFRYKGRNGIDALTLLKEKTEVEQDKTGMVISIGGRKADNEKHEFWSFYINGILASVGSADYKTVDQDEIFWKIDTY